MGACEQLLPALGPVPVLSRCWLRRRRAVEALRRYRRRWSKRNDWSWRRSTCRRFRTGGVFWGINACERNDSMLMYERMRFLANERTEPLHPNEHFPQRSCAFRAHSFRNIHARLLSEDVLPKKLTCSSNPTSFRPVKLMGGVGWPLTSMR